MRSAELGQSTDRSRKKRRGDVADDGSERDAIGAVITGSEYRSVWLEVRLLFYTHSVIVGDERLAHAIRGAFQRGRHSMEIRIVDFEEHGSVEQRINADLA